MLWLDCWEFCTKRNCPDQDPPFPWQENIPFRQWLQESQKDPLKMQALRGLLQQGRIGIHLPRMSDDLVVDQIAELLASGRLHLHLRGATTAIALKQEPASPAVKPAAQEAPFPLGDRQPSPQPAPSEPSSDPPTFPSNLDGAAQAAALSAAAAGGQPFCPE